MKALQFSATGDLAALHVVDLPTPVPAAGQVLVRIKAAGLNPCLLYTSPSPRDS